MAALVMNKESTRNQQIMWKICVLKCTNKKSKKFPTKLSSKSKVVSKITQLESLNLASTSFRVLELLGRGEFGEVSRGILKSSQGGGIEVAVKTSVESDDGSGRVRLLQEAAIMGQFFHPNVIKLIGITTKKDKVGL